MSYVRFSSISPLTTGLGLVWQLGALAGLFYWSYRYDYEAAFLSVVVPLYGAVTVVLDFVR